MRSTSLAALAALALTACVPAAPPGEGSVGPSAGAPKPRVAINLSRPTLQLATPEDFQSGTLAWGVDTASGAIASGQLSRTPVGDGSGALPNLLQRAFVLGRSGHAAVVVAGHHLLVGGRRLGPASSDVVVFNPVTQVLFSAAEGLRDARADHGAVAADGRLYVIGGTASNLPGTSATVASVEVADVDPKTGLPGPFTALDGLLPEARADFAMAVVNGFVYLVGGVDAAGIERDDILYAPILPDGRLGPFVAATATLPPPLGPVTGARATAVDGTVFVVGGQRKSARLAQVFSFRPGANGDVTLVEQNPVGLSRPRTRPAVATAAGQVLVYGGEASAQLGGEAEVAQVVRSGPRLVLPQFVETTGGGSLPEGGAATTDGVSVYTSGGQTSFGPSEELNAWRLAPLFPFTESAAPIHVGQWRRVLDLGRTVQLRSVAVQGRAADGGFARLSWRAATSAGEWGPPSAPVVVLGAGAIPGPVPVSVPGAVAASNWFELVLDLDDDGAFSLPSTGVDLLDLAFAPTAVALVLPPAVTSGACTAVTLELRDGEGRPFATAAALPVAVSLPGNPGPVPATLHDGPLCESGLAGPVVVPASAATATVWVKGGTTGAVQLLAAPTDATIPAATGTVSVAAGPPSAIAFSAGSPPDPVTSLVPFQVQVRLLDAAGNDATGSVQLAIDAAGSVPGGTLAGTTLLPGVTGFATFAGLTLDRAGAHRLRASVPGSTVASLSPVFQVRPGPATRLAFRPVPASAVATARIGAVTVDLLDAAGNVAALEPATPVTLQLATGPAGGALGGTQTRDTAAGTAAFDDLTLSLAGSYTLRATSGTLVQATSGSLPVLRLAIAVPGAGFVSGACTEVPVTLRDAGGAAVAATAALGFDAAVQTGAVPLAATLHPDATCGGPLTGPVTIAAGTSTASVWLRGGTVDAITLLATPALPAAQPFTAAAQVVAGPAAAIAFHLGGPPPQVPALGTFSPQVRVTDGAGNAVAGQAVAIAIAPAYAGLGATLGGLRDAVTGADGVGTFSNLTLDRVGLYQLRASAGALAADSSSIEVVPGAPATLVFAAYPTVVVTGRAFDTSVVVDLLDAAGNLCTNATGANVTLTAESEPAGAVLAGVATRAAVAGKASFPGLSLTPAGARVVLQAASAGLASASSGNVDVQAQGSSNPPVKLAWSVFPLSVPLDTCSSEFRVEALDAADQRVSPAPVDFITVFVAGSGTDPGAVAVFSDPLCATPAASVTIGTAGVATFYVKGSLQKVLTVSADATLSGNRRVIQKDFTVGSAPPPPPAPVGPRPLNGWSCGTTAGGGSGAGAGLAGLLAIGLLFLRRRRGPAAVRPAVRPAAVLAAALVLALAAGPAGAQPAPAPTAPAAKPKPRPSTNPADVPLPPPPRGLTRTPAAEPATAPPPAPSPTPVAAPRRTRDPRPSVAVLNVEGTLTGERLDLAALTDVLATTVDEAGWFRVVSSRDVTAVLALERQKELLGCSADQACIAELAGALGVEYVLSASVGKVGDAYVVSGRMVEAKRGTGVARASTNATGTGLLRAMRATARKLLEGFRAARPAAEQARLVLPGLDQQEEEGAAPGLLSVRLAAVAGLAPGADEGAQRSVGVEAGLGWRLGQAWDLTLTGVGGPTFGGRVGVTRALVDGAVRLSLGLRAAAWPGDSAYGGGPVVELGVPLGRRAALVGYAAVEGYGAKAAQGSFAVLGGAGFQLRL